MVKSRPAKSLRRSLPKKIPNKRELIICEGTETELSYFALLISHLRLYAVDVKIVASPKQDPIELLKYAVEQQDISRSEGNAYDKIWCVCDVEIPPRETLDDAFEFSKGLENVELILTNPSFEYWFLLHFEKRRKEFGTKLELFQKLKEHHSNYKKSRIGFDILYCKTDVAIQNAKDVLRENNCAECLREHNPSTHVHILVEHLRHQN